MIAANSQVDTTTWEMYATVLQLTSSKQGTLVKFDGATETEYATTKYSVMYSVQLIGNNAILMAQRTVPVLRMNSTMLKLKELGIGILSISDVRGVPIAIDGGFEERAQFDLFVSQDTIVKEQLNAVQSVDMVLNIEQ